MDTVRICEVGTKFIYAAFDKVFLFQDKKYGGCEKSICGFSFDGDNLRDTGPRLIKGRKEVTHKRNTEFCAKRSFAC
jgi:hypothetical protein